MTKSQENYIIFNTIVNKLKDEGKVCMIYRDRYSDKKVSIRVVFFDRNDPAIEPLSKMCEEYNTWGPRFNFLDIPKGSRAGKADLSPEVMERLKITQTILKLDGV